MIYITALFFVKEGKELIFQEYEKKVLPILDIYKGKLICRLRPTEESTIYLEGEKPYEVHILSFESEKDFRAFSKDQRRSEFLHLKEASIKSTLLVKGIQL